MRAIFKAIMIFSFMSLLLCGCKKDDDNQTEVSMISEFESDKLIVQTTASSTATGFGAVFENMITDTMERVNFIREYISLVRYFDDQSGYFYVEDFLGWNIAHPLRDDIVGSYRYNVQDVKGNYYHHTMCDLAKTAGEGFVSYYFTNPASNEVEEKMTCIAAIPGIDYFVGTGFYIRSTEPGITVDESNLLITKNYTKTAALGFSGVFEELYTDSLDRLNVIRILIDPIRFFEDETGYFFVNHINGLCLAHAFNDELVGQNQYNLEDSHGNNFIQEMCSVATTTGSGYVTYYWTNPITGADEKKISYIERIPGTDCYIGSGVYLKE
ncbi:MAG: cache domain-containing protein [Bacteroidales bacterium]|nr:cache domain-containing protein [Bacteroidales bacterium]